MHPGGFLGFWYSKQLSGKELFLNCSLIADAHWEEEDVGQTTYQVGLHHHGEKTWGRGGRRRKKEEEKKEMLK